MDTKKDIKLLSFDLGSNYGVAYSSYNRNNNIFTVIKAFSVDLNKFLKNPMEFSGLCSKRRQFLMMFEQQIIEILNNFTVDIYASENAFIQPGRAHAFESLLLYIDTLERLIFLNKKQKLYKISPKTIKMTITGSGNANKLEVEKAILNHPNIRFKRNSIINKLTSHSTDAIATGFYIAKELLSIEF